MLLSAAGGSAVAKRCHNQAPPLCISRCASSRAADLSGLTPLPRPRPFLPLMAKSVTPRRWCLCFAGAAGRRGRGRGVTWYSVWLPHRREYVMVKCVHCKGATHLHCSVYLGNRWVFRGGGRWCGLLHEGVVTGGRGNDCTIDCVISDRCSIV